MKIALIGASSTGKSTLATKLARELKLPLIREQARVVLAELGRTLQEIRARNEDILQFQNRVLEYQIASELECADSGFVSDRSVFDNLTLYLRHCPITPEGIEFYRKNVISHYKSFPYDYLIFLRPGEFPVSDDGVRTPDPFYQAQVDGMILAILKLFSVPYYEVHGDINQRIREVKALISTNVNTQFSS
ncbi:ATP-binding protein [bacterium]|nr:ATP-binding protein [bacterium]